MKSKYLPSIILFVWACLALPVQSVFSAESPLLPPEAFDIARKAFIRVEVYFKKAERPEEVELEGDPYDQRGVQYYIEEKRSKDLVGVVFNEKGDVLMPEIRLDQATVDRIEVISWEGERRPAKIKSLLMDSPAMLLRVEGGGLKNTAPPPFTTAPSPEKEILRVMALYYAQPRWEIQSSYWFGVFNYTTARWYSS